MSSALSFIGPEFPWLAPLAGFTDLSFRLLCREQGAAAACTEMVSAKGLVLGGRRGGRGNEGTRSLLATTPEDAPLVVQLFGAEAEVLGEAVRLLRDQGFSWFDLNMGCSVPKVTKTGAGAALLRDLPRALACAGAMVEAALPGRVGCKLRLGWEAPVFQELGRQLEGTGVAWLALHPRFARQRFSGTARAEALAELADVVTIPVLASGDLLSARQAVERLPSGVKGVMFARGALHDPAIFTRYRRLLRGEGDAEPSCGELWRLILRHIELARAFPGVRSGDGRPPGLLKMRAVVPRYIRNLPGTRRLRQELIRCASWEELRSLVDDFFRHGGESSPNRV